MIDTRRLALALLTQALRDAESDDIIGRRARIWLSIRPNRLRDAIIDGATNLTQDDIDAFVRRLDGTTTS